MLAACLVTPGRVLAENGPSLEGFSGQLTTPSAWALSPGTAHLVFTNSPRVEDATTRTYLVDVGFLPYLEIAGRVTDVSSPDGPRDLSFNAKLQLPLDRLAPRLPFAVAVGTQDEGGAATFFRTRYAVASARLGPVTLSGGWGTGPQRMDGAFAGGALTLLPGVEALAEWDAANVNAGLRLALSLARIGLPLRIGGVGMSALDRRPRTIEWGATLELPLWLNAGPEGRRPVRERGAAAGRPSDAKPSGDAVAGAPRPALAAGESRTTGSTAEEEALGALEASLVRIGFEEVRVGRDGDTLVVEYENSVFNHAEADGVYVVAREIARAGLAGGDAVLVLKQNGLRIAELGLPGGPPAGREERPGWKLDPPERRAAWVSSQPRNRRALHASLVLAPGLTTFVATQVGVLDYVVSFRPDVVLPLWPGATGFARFDVPLAWSDDLRDGGALQQYRDDPRVEYALLHQAFPVAGGLWAMVGGGIFRTTDAGGLGELLWAPGDGALALGVQGSWSVNDQGDERRGLTGSGRLAFAPLDLVATVRAGQFVNGDRGATVQLARWFGDTQFGLFLTWTDVSIAGAFVSVPLTPRRDMRPGWIQVRGRRFAHDVGTVVGEERNAIRTGLGIAPLSPWNLEASYLDDARVTRDGLAGALRTLP
ncbi:MAG TPA: YjbH domain-containing protein [Anaeromyxobacter sp.]|nr:YjbH domain-containing protein [Anaeromyxobacter sp.]